MFTPILNFLAGMNNFTGFITLLVGGVAIYLYLKQRADRKRDAARLILQEIRYAEDKIRKYRATRPPQYRLHDRLLPTNSWTDNINLFIKDLKETEIDLISDFYAKASYIDIVIQKISDQKNNPSQSQQPVIVPASPQQPSTTPGQGFSPQPQVSQIEISLNFPQVSQEILNDVSTSVEFIYNTPVVEKLRSISERKWYQLY